MSLKAYYSHLYQLFRVGGLLDELSKLRRHYENLTKGEEIFRSSLLGVSSKKFFERHYLFGRRISECSEERIKKELRRMGDNAGIDSYDGLLYQMVVSALIRADKCAQDLHLKTLKPKNKRFWKVVKGKLCPIQEYVDFISKYTYCKDEVNYLGKTQECFIDSHNRNAIRRRLEVMKKYGLKYSIHEMETLNRRELEKDKRRAQRHIGKGA